MTRVSWLIPFRDAEAWIAESIQSVLDEASETDEIILIDDGSTDSSVAKLPKDQRIRLLQQKPQGIVAALEAGRSIAKAEFIARMDADDHCLPGRINAQLAALRANPKLAAIGGQAEIHSDGDTVGEGMQRYVNWVNQLQDVHRELLVESPLFHPAVCFRAEAVEEVGGYRQGDFPEDYELWLRLVAAGWRIDNLPRKVVRIRDRPERLTRSDPRYNKAAFRHARQDFLGRTHLATPSRVVIWGGKKGARPWIQWLKATGHELVAVVDIVPGHERGGRPLVLPERLPNLDFDLLLVAVGQRGARTLIREELNQLCPHRIEGQDWFAVL